ncbi:unnamed protein product [Arabis nemorensis]|uniref:Uncharacterized protein n=1 Tax=Arabis nemorensis TaxID=586526 RepID=A0A565CMX9_9BRAS|nr:unnamed protein product [Arabis nemorensis]
MEAENMFEVTRDLVVIMCGTWECRRNGVWDFTIDKKQMGRCFNVGARVKPTFTYWVPCTIPLIDTVKNPPVAFTTDEGFYNYKAMRAMNKGVTLFVEFRSVQFPGQEYSADGGWHRELVYSPEDVFPANCTRASGDSQTPHSLEGEDEAVWGDDPASDEEFEDSDGSIRHESEGEEDEEYDMDHWTDLISREYGAWADEPKDDGTTSGVDGAEETVEEETRQLSTFVPLSLQNMYADIRSDEGFYAVDAAPMFDEFDEIDRDLCYIDFATTEDAVYKGQTFKNKRESQIT